MEYVEVGPKQTFKDAKEVFKDIIDSIPTWSRDTISIDEDQTEFKPQPKSTHIKCKSLFEEIKEVDPLFDLPDNTKAIFSADPDSEICTQCTKESPVESPMESKRAVHTLYDDTTYNFASLLADQRLIKNSEDNGRRTFIYM
jgi:hypothetical protein